MVAWLRAFMLAIVLTVTSFATTWSATGAATETLTLALGAGSMLKLHKPFDTVLIDNPDVVDVRALNDRSVLLEPLNPGVANVVFLDRRSIAVANIRVVVSDTRASRAHSGQSVYAGRPVPSLSRHAT
jgi:Flp pilus assembly secretin CpaC